MGPDTIVLDDDNQPVKPEKLMHGAHGNVPLGYYKDPADGHLHRGRRQALLGP
jgi:hypothetical protein